MVAASLSDAVVTVDGFPVLSGVTTSIAAEGLTILRGPNGSGKTSLLRLLGGLHALTRGSGEVLGVDLVNGDRRQVRRRVGWLGHEGAFYDDLTVTENLAFAARALGRPSNTIAPALERVGLADRAHTSTRLLSAGQRRRLALAWLVVRRPALWLLDEPYASLDTEGRELLDALVADAIGAKAAVVLSAHDELRLSVSGRTLVLVGGRVADEY